MSAPLYSVLHMSTNAQLLEGTDCDTAAVAARLRVLREAAGVTQAGLAARLGTTQSAVARLEAGRQRMNLDAVARVASALGCTASLVITGGSRERR